MVSLLAGRVALVTGGARGLGLEMASALGEAGASVCLVDLLDDVDAAAADLAERTGAEAVGVTADVTSPESVARAFDVAQERLGLPTVLLCAAGVALEADSLDLSLAAWQRVLDVNLNGTFLACQEFARRCTAASQPGTIVNISSMSGQVVNVPQHQAAYNVSKAAVAMLTRSLAVEWLPLGIRVNAIAPGYFASDMTRDFVASHPAMADEWRSRIPMGRMGEPRELGPLAVYLASDQSSYMVGQNVVIDGGYVLV
jgi:NAD(P)-dependent dehydrogenase (short-subunit alcohol dehydrogenase family)